jgi:hypothetical protein
MPVQSSRHPGTIAPIPARKLVSFWASRNRGTCPKITEARPVFRRGNRGPNLWGRWRGIETFGDGRLRVPSTSSLEGTGTSKKKGPIDLLFKIALE